MAIAEKTIEMDAAMPRMSNNKSCWFTVKLSQGLSWVK